jgi:hypothetical protein
VIGAGDVVAPGKVGGVNVPAGTEVAAFTVAF